MHECNACKTCMLFHASVFGSLHGRLLGERVDALAGRAGWLLLELEVQATTNLVVLLQLWRSQLHVTVHNRLHILALSNQICWIACVTSDWVVCDSILVVSSCSAVDSACSLSHHAFKPITSAESFAWPVCPQMVLTAWCVALDKQHHLDR